MCFLATVIGESVFEAQADPIIVSGYSGICFESKFSGRHRGFDSVLFNNNNNHHDNVYSAVIMAEPLREFTRFI